MIKRFFMILQRNWTYEMEYGLEAARLVFINLVTIGIPAILYRIPNVPRWVFVVFGFGPALVFWWVYTAHSVGRIIQIKANRKHAIKIDKSQIPLLLEAYPKQTLWVKAEGKYKGVTSSDEVGDNEEMTLICIGKKPIHELRKIKTILNDKN